MRTPWMLMTRKNKIYFIFKFTINQLDGVALTRFLVEMLDNLKSHLNLQAFERYLPCLSTGLP